MPNAEKFIADMVIAEIPVDTDYHGRNFYVGPAVVIDEDLLQSIIRATSVKLQWDNLGKNSLIVYPVL